MRAEGKKRAEREGGKKRAEANACARVVREGGKKRAEVKYMCSEGGRKEKG